MPRPIAVRPLVGSAAVVAARLNMTWSRAKATWSSWLVCEMMLRVAGIGGARGSVLRVDRAADVHRGQDREDERLQEADEDFEPRHRDQQEERERHDHDG